MKALYVKDEFAILLFSFLLLHNFYTLKHLIKFSYTTFKFSVFPLTGRFPDLFHLLYYSLYRLFLPFAASYHQFHSAFRLSHILHSIFIKLSQFLRKHIHHPLHIQTHDIYIIIHLPKLRILIQQHNNIIR